MPSCACSNLPACACCAGENNLFVAEQGGFEQAIRNGCAVDGNERPALRAELR